jgi:hypothetical protein
MLNLSLKMKEIFVIVAKAVSMQKDSMSDKPMFFIETSTKSYPASYDQFVMWNTLGQDDLKTMKFILEFYDFDFSKTTIIDCRKKFPDSLKITPEISQDILDLFNLKKNRNNQLSLNQFQASGGVLSIALRRCRNLNSKKGSNDLENIDTEEFMNEEEVMNNRLMNEEPMVEDEPTLEETVDFEKIQFMNN